MDLLSEARSLFREALGEEIDKFYQQFAEEVRSVSKKGGRVAKFKIKPESHDEQWGLMAAKENLQKEGFTVSCSETDCWNGGYSTYTITISGWSW